MTVSQTFFYMRIKKNDTAPMEQAITTKKSSSPQHKSDHPKSAGQGSEEYKSKSPTALEMQQNDHGRGLGESKSSGALGMKNSSSAFLSMTATGKNPLLATGMDHFDMTGGTGDSGTAIKKLTWGGAVPSRDVPKKKFMTASQSATSLLGGGRGPLTPHNMLDSRDDSQPLSSSQNNNNFNVRKASSLSVVNSTNRFEKPNTTSHGGHGNNKMTRKISSATMFSEDDGGVEYQGQGNNHMTGMDGTAKGSHHKSKEGLSSVDGSVYGLEIANQNTIDPNYYFTLSKEGVTQYSNKTSQFTSLAQWHREYLLFHRISSIRFFRLYKRWKAFSVWKRGLRNGKMKLAGSALDTNLFLFNPPLRRALLKVRELSAPMASLGLLSLPVGKTFDLDDFVKEQASVHGALQKQLEDLSNDVIRNVRLACDEVVDQFLKANNIAANHKMTFMERAALRAECKRLTRFLRSVDIMMTDFLWSMVRSCIYTSDFITCAYLSVLPHPTLTNPHLTLHNILEKTYDQHRLTNLPRIYRHLSTGAGIHGKSGACSGK